MLVHSFIRISILIPQTNYCLLTGICHIHNDRLFSYRHTVLIKSFLISRRSQANELVKTPNW